MTCRRCAQPMLHVHASVTAAYDGNDRRLIEFLERHQSDGRSWDVFECVNTACGCGCRRYLAKEAQ